MNRLQGSLKKSTEILIIFLLASAGTLSGSEKCFILSNKEISSIYPEEISIYQLSTKKFARSGYQVKHVDVKNPGSFLELFSKVAEKEPGGIFVANSIFSPLLIKDDAYIKFKKFKIVTWGIFSDYKFGLSSPVFNITVDPDTVSDRIIRVLRKISKKKDLSDILMVINTDYGMTENIQEYYEEQKLKINFIDRPQNSAMIKNWITNNGNMEAIVFFAFKDNRIINDMENTGLKDLKLIEIMTGYGQSVPSVLYSIDIDWFYVFYQGISNPQFYRFLLQKRSEPQMTNYFVRKNRSVLVKKNSHTLIREYEENQKETEK
jgi:hypothetical protein